MKRLDLERYLRGHGCQRFKRSGKHEVWWNPANGMMSTIPRCHEINDLTVRNLCRDLQIPPSINLYLKP